MSRSKSRIAPWILAALASVPKVVSGETPPDRPAAIRIDGVPAIPASLRATLAPYQNIRSTRFVGWAADGNGMLVAKRPENLYQLHLVRTPGSEPRQLTDLDEPVTHGEVLADGTLVFSGSRGGSEQYQIYRRLPDGEIDCLTDGTSRNLMGKVHPDGRRLVFTSTRRNGRDADLFLMNLTGDAQPRSLLEVSGETWSLSDWSADGSRALLSRYISRNEAYAVVFDLASRTTTPLPSETAALKGPQGPQNVSRASYRFGPEARNVFFVTDARGEFRELARMDVRSGAVTWLTEDLDRDVESLAVSKDRKRAAFAVNVDGYSGLYLLDGLTLEKPARRRVEMEPALLRNLEFSPDGKRLGFTLGRPTSPSEAYSLELETGEIERWTTSERAGFDEMDFVKPALIRYKTFDGREVPAFLYLPQRRQDGPGKKVPVVITIHGGPESQFRPWFSAFHQYQVKELGAAVIAPNVRGSTGYGKTYTRLDNGTKREDSVRDIGALLDWIGDVGAREMGLDPERVAVMGASYGGYMVLASLIHHGERLRAGVDIVGISDFETFLKNTKAYRRDLRRAEYGDERQPEIQRFFARISPARRIDRLRTPLFLVHGVNDPRVPFAETLQVVDRARATGQTVWTLYAANEGHGFRRRENCDYQDAAVVVFLRRFLLDQADDRARTAVAVRTDQGRLRSLEELLIEYYLAGGRGMHFRLSPDSAGLIAEADVRRLLEVSREVRRRFATKLASAGAGGNGTLELRFDAPTRVDHTVLAESATGAGRVKAYVIETLVGQEWRRIRQGRTIGRGRIDWFEPFRTSALRVRVEEAEGQPTVAEFAAFDVLGDVSRLHDDAKTLVSRGRFDEALEAVSRVIEAVPAYAPAHVLRGRIHTEQDRFEAAVGDFTVALRLEGDAPALRHMRANELFKLGRFDEAIRDYDRSIAGETPHDDDSCWERGLAYYYVGDHERGRRQFDGYHRVGPLDIENGIWRFLCIAENEGLERARETFWPYPRKVRPPFPALHAVYSGEGSADAVLEEAVKAAKDPQERSRNLFYAHYYLGKYFEIRRQFSEALAHVEKALGHRVPHFMYHCARLDRERLAAR